MTEREYAEFSWADPNPSGLCGCGCGELTRVNTRNDSAKGWTRGHHRRFIKGHKVRPDRYEVNENGCWIWLGYIDKAGYGREGGSLAHRVYYEAHKGPIPFGLDLDHLCRNRACVNPAHLEAVTRAVNCQRGLMTRLTTAQVEEIRASNEPGKVLALRYGVHPYYIWQVRTYRKRVAA